MEERVKIKAWGGGVNICVQVWMSIFGLVDHCMLNIASYSNEWYVYFVVVFVGLLCVLHLLCSLSLCVCVCVREREKEMENSPTSLT